MAVSRREAVARLWNLGVLTWKLDPVQHDLYKTFKDAKAKTIVWSCSRRLGKSYALCCIAIEHCLVKPNTKVKFIAPTQKHVKMIIHPLLKEIFEDCPAELKPAFRTADNIYRFGNGSEIQLAGTDAGHAESLRGGSADLCIIDEAGFCDDLRYIIQSILIPTTTTTRGKIILSSTPPKSPDHEFVKYMEDAEARGNFVKRTIYDGLGARITPEIIQEIIDELGGTDSLDFRREYMCEVVRDEAFTVVPEFTDIVQAEVIKEWKRPSHFDAYVSGDLGAKDYTVFLFGYWDFRAAKLIIEDEVVMRGKKVTTDLMAEGIKETEKRLWTDPLSNEVKPPYMRVCDNDLIVINNLREQNDILFFRTEKYDKQAAINNMRVLLKERRLIIHPRCKTLIQHIKYASWAKDGKKFARSVAHGHYDAVDALVYMCRSVQQFKNPFPHGFGQAYGDNVWPGREDKDIPPAFQKFKDLFTPKHSLGRPKFTRPPPPDKPKKPNK